METNLYIATASFGIKIGKAQKPDARVRALAKEHEEPVRLLYTFSIPEEYALDIEYLAHWYLRKVRIFGEWFNCSVTRARLAAQYGIDNYHTVDRGSRRAYLDAQIEEDGLLRLLIHNGGRLTKNEANLQFGGYLGHASRRLHMRGLIEPWSDVLVLTPAGRSLATIVLAARQTTNGDGPTRDIPLPEPPTGGD